MEYEWNEIKAVYNFRKHGVSFDEAKTVFDDPMYIDFYDPQHSATEDRYLIIGATIKGRIVIVSYTERNNNIRLISARIATKNELRVYEYGR